MKKILPIIIMLSLLLFSCSSPDYSKRNIYFVSVSLDYRSQSCNTLYATNHDQYGLVRQLLALDDTIDAKLYLEYDSNRYVLSTSGGNYPPSSVETKTALDVLPYKVYSWSSSDIFRTLDEIAELANEDDLFIFQYSGHGYAIDNKKTGELVLSVSSGSSIIELTDSISPNELLAKCEAMDCLSLLILDSCYSGNFVKYNTTGSGNVFEAVNPSSSKSDDKLKMTNIFEAIAESFRILTNEEEKKTPDIYVFAAATKNQTSWDSDNSVWPADTEAKDKFGGFTFYLLKAMGYDPYGDEPHNTGATITLYSLFDSIWKEMKKYHRSMATPTVTLSPLDIILFN